MTAEGPTTADDGMLVDRIRSGDRLAFEELVRRKRQQAFRLARRVVGEDEDARDVVQLAFLRVWRKVRGFRRGSEFDPWFHRIVVNLSIDFVRRESARRRGQTDWARQSMPEAGRSEGASPSEVPKGLQVQEVSRIFDELASCLPPRQRAIFALREMEGMSTETVARVLGVRSSTVRNHLFQARTTLRRLLSARYPEYAPGRPERGEDE
jgi:RNA polymerase sigma-70 factor (ECF subfamily)